MTGLAILAQVLFGTAGQTLGGLGDNGRFHGPADDATSVHDVVFLSGGAVAK